MEDYKLQKKLKELEKRSAMIECLADFLRRFPDLASGSTLKPSYRGMTLDLGTATIRPVWKDRVQLRLEWDPEECDEEMKPADRIICEDLLALAEAKLIQVLRRVGADEE